MDDSRPKSYDPERWKRAVAALPRWALKLNCPRLPEETDLEWMSRIRAKFDAIPMVRII